MSQARGTGTAAGRPGGSGGSAGSRGSAWAPFAHRVFRALWLAQFVSNIGSWMQTVGAQWVLIGHGAALVSLVQVASGLPVLLLALPAGVLADLVDRRRLLLTMQAGMAVVAVALAVLAFAGRLQPGLLLALTFLMGCGNALNAPAWQALQPTLVPRDELRQASALGAVNQNVARAIGPALGGALVAVAGIGWNFALNAVSFIGILAVLVFWKPAPRPPRDTQEREQALAALRAGGRYVRRAPRVRRILLRTGLFIPGAAALWALLPVTANQALGLGSGGYGLLLGAVGVGAVGGAAALSPLSRRLGVNGMLTLSGLLFAAVLVLLALVPSVPAAVVALAVAGAAWIWGLSTLNASLQLGLPAWVRARGNAFYLLVFQGGSAVGSFAWGELADTTSLTTALVSAAGLLVAGVVTLPWLPLRDGRVDPSVSDGWPEPNLVMEPSPQDGPVLVQVDYTVGEENAARFVRAMSRVEDSRRRTGATTWGLYQDAARADRFIETFTLASWSEHLAQHHSRYTGVDREFEGDARALLAAPPQVTHALMRRVTDV
jgi:predicted MFS family arabinose efflux permease